KMRSPLPTMIVMATTFTQWVTRTIQWWRGAREAGMVGESLRCWVNESTVEFGYAKALARSRVPRPSIGGEQSGGQHTRRHRRHGVRKYCAQPSRGLDRRRRGWLA